VVNMDEDFRDQSEFNMAVSTLTRLNVSLFLCNDHFRNMRLFQCFHELIILYTEVCTDMKGDLLNLVTQGQIQDKKKSATDEFEIMENYISEVEPMVSSFSQGTASPEIIKKLYTKLRFMKMLLLRIMKDAGLLMKMKQDARFAL
jgi:hypothetical protein